MIESTEKVRQRSKFLRIFFFTFFFGLVIAQKRDKSSQKTKRAEGVEINDAGYVPYSRNGAISYAIEEGMRCMTQRHYPSPLSA